MNVTTVLVRKKRSDDSWNQMPLVDINLSVPLSEAQIEAIVAEVIPKLSKASGKAAEKFMVVVRGGAKICFAGTFEPTGYVQMAGISGFTHEFNDEATAIFSEVLAPHGIQASRLFVTFTQREKTHWALHGKTYASQ